jgi:small-conductance mechanosensitive channel
MIYQAEQPEKPDEFYFKITYSVDHMAGRSPKLGERAYARSPNSCPEPAEGSGILPTFVKYCRWTQGQLSVKIAETYFPGGNMQTYFDQFIENIITALPNVLTAILIFVASLYVGKLLSRLLVNVLARRRADPGVTHLLGQIIRWSVIVAGMITAIQRFFDVTAFLAGLGILGFTIGFALQNIMQNFASGVILLIQQPFNVGDAIDVNGYGGTVLSINLGTTEMRTFDGLIVIIPNADVLSNTITNYTRAKLRRVELPVGVSYGADPAKVRSIILDAIQNVPGLVHEPAPIVVPHTFGGSTIEMSAYFWFDTAKTDPLSAKAAALELIKAALEKNDIKHPFPITTLVTQSTEE